jgi:hypothetical protein
MSDLDEYQTRRVAALDNVLHLFRGQTVKDMPDTVSLLSMAEWVIDGTAQLASRTAEAEHRRNHYPVVNLVTHESSSPHGH